MAGTISGAPAQQPGRGELVVDLLLPPHEQEWDEYVRRHPQGTIYHLCGWRQVIRETYGHEAYYLAAHRGEGQDRRLVGVLPLIALKHFLLGARLVSIPFFDKGGVLADDKVVAETLVQRAIALGTRIGVKVIELRHHLPPPFAAEGQVFFPPRIIHSHKVGMELPLPQSAAALWDGFKAKLRSQIRKPLKAGLTVRTGGKELLAAFYQVFAVNMRDLGSPVHSPKMMASVLRVFGARAAILLVCSRELPVAGGLVVGDGPVLANPWASSLRRFSDCSPNMLLYWSMLEFACRQGYGVFDFGRSTPGGGTYRFKKQWGAQERPLFWENIEFEPGSGADRNGSRRLQTAVRCWQKLPVAWSKVLGPMIRKHIDL